MKNVKPLIVHSLNSGKVSIQIQLKALSELSEWTLSSLAKLNIVNVRRPGSNVVSTTVSKIERLSNQSGVEMTTIESTTR